MPCSWCMPWWSVHRGHNLTMASTLSPAPQSHPHARALTAQWPLPESLPPCAMRAVLGEIREHTCTAIPQTCRAGQSSELIGSHSGPAGLLLPGKVAIIQRSAQEAGEMPFFDFHKCATWYGMIRMTAGQLFNALHYTVLEGGSSVLDIKLLQNVMSHLDMQMSSRSAAPGMW